MRLRDSCGCLRPFRSTKRRSVYRVAPGLSIQDAIANAQGKAAGVFPADLGRALCSVTKEDWETIRWINQPSLDSFLTQLNELGEGLLLPGNL